MATKFNRLLVLLAATTLFIGVSSVALAGEYEGKWLLSDTKGKPLEITLNKDGTATGPHKSSMKGTYKISMKQGTWKEEGGAAVIHWNTGWTTRIEKQGDKYVKSAFKAGRSLSGPPTSTSEAIKKE